jgi:hypothetical protein
MCAEIYACGLTDSSFSATDMGLVALNQGHTISRQQNSGFGAFNLGF